MSKSSRRAKAARKQVAPAAEDFVHSAADRVGPLVHTAADRVGPLAQSAATRVGPLAEAAADRIGAAADKVSPLAHSAADRVGPMAQSAAERVGPVTHGAADRIAPLAHSAADRIAPLATGAVERVSPYAQQAASRVSPYAHQAAERIAPIATSAKQRGARVAHDAVEKFGPALDEALERVSPAVESARGKMSSEILPKLSEALSAAAGAPVVVEVAKRGKAAVAAAKGELELPKEKKKSRWLKRLAIVAAIAGVAVVVVRKFLGAKDADWQAARPTTPYAPPQQAERPRRRALAAQPQRLPLSMRWTRRGEDPQGGMSAHLMNLEADGAAMPDQPAEGGDIDELASTIWPLASTKLSPRQQPNSATKLPPRQRASVSRRRPRPPPLTNRRSEPQLPTKHWLGRLRLATRAPRCSTRLQPLPKPDGRRYEGEGVYVGSEPPEGFTIKGNERSMKYHVPESAGYGRTVAEVWFNSEEAAQEAGFVRAQR